MDFSKLDDIMLIVNDIKEELIKEYTELEKKLLNEIASQKNNISSKEEKINELQKKIDENNFNENNYNRVSILRTLSKENDELKQQNTKLMASLNYRNNRTNTPSSQYDGSELEDSNDLKNEEFKIEPVEVNKTEVNNIEVDTEVNNTEVDTEVNNKEVDTIEVPSHELVNNSIGEENLEDEVEVNNKIEYKGKFYYIEENNAYRVKKNGDKGKKVGIYSNEKIKFTEKKNN